jgi:hypothetical protein
MAEKNQLPSLEYKGELFMVTNLLNEFSIVDSNNQKAVLRMSQFGFFSVVPVFITMKGATDYCDKNKIDRKEIFKLQ